ncbi:MAG: peroxidase [Candidatus Marinimicrobia bacterium]|nr:peroxidase [Candidatus Neomarinimicrobiota bacterium]
MEALAQAGDHEAFTLQDKAILQYAVKLTKTPADMGKLDVEVLRSRGLNDRAIHDVCAITAYFGFVNRIADGLGVELEPRFDAD